MPPSANSSTTSSSSTSTFVIINGVVVGIVVLSVVGIIISYSSKNYYVNNSTIRRHHDVVPVSFSSPSSSNVAGGVRRSSISKNKNKNKNINSSDNKNDDDDDDDDHDGMMKSKSTSKSKSSTRKQQQHTERHKFYARHREQFYTNLPPQKKNQLMSTEEYWDEWIQFGFEERRRRRRRRRKKKNRWERQDREGQNERDGDGDHDYDDDDDGDNDYYDQFYQLDEMKKQWMASATASPMGFPLELDGWDDVDNVTCVVGDDDDDDDDDVAHVPVVGIILGTQKGGSTALNNFLQQHPRVAPTYREIHFMSGDMDRLVSGTYFYSTNNNKNQQPQKVDLRDRNITTSTSTDRFYRNPTDGGINQTASQAMYLKTLTNYLKSDMVERKKLRNEQLLEETNDEELYGRRPMLMVDKSPSYVVQSDRVPYRILCTCPWAKLVMLLREPISRAYSQYNMIRHSKNKHLLSRIPPTFDEWVEQDYQILTKLGVLRPDKSTTGEDDDYEGGYRGSPEEKRGWKAYTRLAVLGSTGPIGRGLYSIQISQWIEAYRENGRELLGRRTHTSSSSSPSTTTSKKDHDDDDDDDEDPSEKTLLVLSSDFTKSNPDEAFGIVCDHFGLPRIPLSSSPRSNNTTSNGRMTMSTTKKENKQQLTRGGRGGTNQGKYDDGVVEPMTNKTREKLRRIFAPYNRQLADLLGDAGWKDIWT